MDDVKKYVLTNGLGEIRENRTFKEYTTLKVGGRIRLVYYPNSIDNFLKFHKYYIPLQRPLFVIGAGSNVFASDDDFDGVVVSFSKLPLRYYRVGDNFTCYPGCSVVRLAYDLSRLGYTGGEFLAGIPATIGGAVYMNAGANGSEMKDILVSAKLLCKDGSVKEYKNNELGFAYRKSRLQEEGLIVLEVKLRFTKSDTITVRNKLNELKSKRNSSQPVDEKCAGCTFQNPAGHSAWKLIDQIGFRGYKINQAQVSEKHCNFLINNGNAKSEDLMKLIKEIQENVKREFDIDLKCEWVLVNFDSKSNILNN